MLSDGRRHCCPCSFSEPQYSQMHASGNWSWSKTHLPCLSKNVLRSLEWSILNLWGPVWGCPLVPPPLLPLRAKGPFRGLWGDGAFKSDKRVQTFYGSTLPVGEWQSQCKALYFEFRILFIYWSGPSIPMACKHPLCFVGSCLSLTPLGICCKMCIVVCVDNLVILGRVCETCVVVVDFHRILIDTLSCWCNMWIIIHKPPVRIYFLWLINLLMN